MMFDLKNNTRYISGRSLPRGRVVLAAMGGAYLWLLKTKSEAHLRLAQELRGGQVDNDSGFSFNSRPSMAS